MQKSPDAFRTISEVADWLGIPTHVLRFWESRFSQVKPVKRAGGRRYYRPSDMLLIGGIKRLLHDDGMTIRGVQRLLREEGVRHVQSLSRDLAEEAPALETEAVEVVARAVAAADRGSRSRAVPSRARPAMTARDEVGSDREFDLVEEQARSALEPVRPAPSPEIGDLFAAGADLAPGGCEDDGGDGAAGHGPAPTFGSVRHQHPDLPVLRPAVRPGRAAEPQPPGEGTGPDVAAPEAGTARPAVGAEAPRSIPVVPASDPAADPDDASPDHARPAGRLAATFALDRARLAQAGGLPRAVAALRALRDRSAG